MNKILAQYKKRITGHKRKIQDLELEQQNNELEQKKKDKELEKIKNERHRRNIQVITKCQIVKFDGGDNIEPWLRNLELFTNLNKDVMSELEEIEKVTFVKMYLTERVQMVIDRDQSLTTLTKIISKLRTTYANQVDWNRRLYNLVQEDNETVTEFLARIRIILNKTDDANAPMNKIQLDDRTLKIFWYKSKAEIEKSLTLLCPETIEKAFAHALVVEENLNKVEEPHKKKVKFDTLNLVQTDNRLEKAEIENNKEPYKNDIGNRFKQLNEKVMELKSSNEKEPNE